MAALLFVLVLLTAITLTILSSPRAITAQARRQLYSNLLRWQEQTDLSLGPDGLTGRRAGVPVHVTDSTAGLTIRCQLELGPPDLALLVNARLVPLGFTFVQPDAPGVARWMLARREHIPFAQRWLRDRDLMADLATFLSNHRARVRGGWLELDTAERPEDIVPLLDGVASLAARLRAAWRQPRQDIAEAWGIVMDVLPPGWGMAGYIHGARVLLSMPGESGALTAWLPQAPDTLAISRRIAGADRVRVGSALLDTLLTIRCPPPHAAFQDPDLAAALLAAVLGEPGATIKGATIRMGDIPDDPVIVADAVARLGALLELWPTLPGPGDHCVDGGPVRDDR